MEYRIEIIKDCKEIMDWFETVQSILVKLGGPVCGRSTGQGYDVYVTIDDMHDWINRAVDQYGKLKIVRDIDDKLTIVLGYEII